LKKRPSVVYSPHSIASGLGVAYRFIENGLATVTERFIAVSKSERSQLLALGLAPQSQIDVVHPVVDGRYFEPKSEAAAKAALGLTGATVLLGIGRLSDQKNPFDFFEIAARVRAAVPGTKALWVGDGELRGALEKRIAAENASSWFEILGWRADVRSYIAAADLVISASRYESFGYATVEALAMERPVIASNVLGTRDIMLDDLSKMMYAPKDTRAAVELCISALRLRQHTAEIVRKGRIALLKRYSSDALRLDLTRSYQLAAEPHL
jgi:glycosyltransferase involved in cell wall biosynthesis